MLIPSPGDEGIEAKPDSRYHRATCNAYHARLMVGKFRTRVAVLCATAAVCTVALPCRAALVTWQFSGVVGEIYVNGVLDDGSSLGTSTGSLWHASVTYDPDALPEYTDPVLFQNFPDSVTNLEFDSDGFFAQSDSTLPQGHVLVVARSGVKDLMQFGSQVYTTTSTYVGLVNLGVGATTDAFSFDHLPTSPPDPFAGGGLIVEGNVADAFGSYASFVINGT